MKSTRLSRIAFAIAALGYDRFAARYPSLTNKNGTGELRAKRSRELVDELKAAAEAKRARKAAKRTRDAQMRDYRYYRTDFSTIPAHCFHGDTV